MKKITQEDINIRTECFSKFRKWKLEGRILPNYTWGEGRRHIAWLMRENDYVTMKRHMAWLMRENDYVTMNLYEYIDIMRAISGPHGWSIYKMLVARRLGQ
jgi:hypothetical protein